MANSEQLRRNKNQHKPKNTYSKKDDKNIHLAMHDTIKYLENRFHNMLSGYQLTWENTISFRTMMSIVKDKGLRQEFDTVFSISNEDKSREIKPDGGVIYLIKKGDSNYLKIILISETKRQGTNDVRIKEGKQKQAQGNAIERLGKNLTGIKAMLNHEKITPFVCFGWGCDFEQDYTYEDFVMSKISMLNEFYYLNKTYVFKQNGSADHNSFAPVSMYFRKHQWTREEMFEINKEIAETALRYYLF